MLALAVMCALPVGSNARPEHVTEPPRVWLDGQRGVLDASPADPVLRFRALVHSRLTVPVEAVEVGVLFASAHDDLVAADPAALYAHPPDGEHNVGAVNRWLPVALSPGGEARVLVEAPLAPADPEPAAWVSHVLGYRLADFSLPLLCELLATDVPADEVAVVETLALAGDASRKRAVRARWGRREDLVEGLIALVRAPLPDKPGLQVTLERVMAIRALGVLGGDEAIAALRALLDDPGQAALTEPLVVMGIARLRGSFLEAPMAHALPPLTRRLGDVVAAALDDANGPLEKKPDPESLPDASSAAGAAQGSSNSTDGSGDAEGSSQGDPTKTHVSAGHRPQLRRDLAVLGVLAVVGVALGLVLARRRNG